MSSEIANRMNDVVSDWYSANEMDKLLTVVKEGDALEFNRGNYNHWGIFVGKMKIGVEVVEGNKAKMYAKQLQSNLKLKLDIDVIKGTNEATSVEITNGVVHAFVEGKNSYSSYSSNGAFNILGLLLNTNGACVDCMELQDVLAKSHVRINNKMSEEYSIYDPREIVLKAIKSIGKYNYSLLFNNCEHFVNKCRFGKKISKQAETVKTGSLASAATVATGTLALLGLALSKK